MVCVFLGSYKPVAFHVMMWAMGVAEMFVVSRVAFDQSGLLLRKDELARRVWLNGFNDVLELRSFAVAPDVPTNVFASGVARAFYGQALLAANAELLDVARLEVAGVAALRLVFSQAVKPRGVQYVGSVTLLFKDGSFVFKAQALEVMQIPVSHDAAWDAAHPEHGLARVRLALRGFVQSAVLDAGLLGLPKFGQKRGLW